MTISELQQTAQDGQRFYAYARHGPRYLCEWKSVKRGLFVLLESNGKPLRTQIRCKSDGIPDTRVEALTLNPDCGASPESNGGESR